MFHFISSVESCFSLFQDPFCHMTNTASCIQKDAHKKESIFLKERKGHHIDYYLLIKRQFICFYFSIPHYYVVRFDHFFFVPFFLFFHCKFILNGQPKSDKNLSLFLKKSLKKNNIQCRFLALC